MSRPTFSISPRSLPLPRLLLTRPEPQSLAFADALAVQCDAEFEPLVSPVLRIVRVPLAVDPIGFDGLVFTSRNGVRAFAEASTLRDRPAWCVGDATARDAADIGLPARSASGTLKDLAGQLRQEATGMRLLQLRGRHVAGDLAALIGPDGPKVTEAVLYDQITQALTAQARAVLAEQIPVLVPLFSPRSAGLVADHLIEAVAPLHIAAMSPAVAEALPVQVRSGVVIAPAPNAEGMLQTVGALIRGVKPA